MEEEKDLKKLLEIKGKVRGSVLNSDIKYILDEKGEEGVKKINREVKKIAPSFDYNKIKNTDWYPIGWRAISLLMIIQTFNWGEEEIFKMGCTAPKNSFIARTVLRFFASIKKTAEEIPKYWKKHYSIGEMINERIDVKNKVIVTDLKNFDIHPCLLNYFRGYFQTIAELATKSKYVNVEGVRLISRGKAYCKFTIRWK